MIMHDSVATLDDLIYRRILAMGGFEVSHGERYANNIGRAILKGSESTTDVPLPDNLSYRKVYDSVCRLLQEGRIARVSTVRSQDVYGSLGRPSRVNQRCAVFKAVV